MMLVALDLKSVIGLRLLLPGDRRGGSQLVCDMALIDGEAGVLRDDGRSDFRALMTKCGGAQASFVVFTAFDLPRLNGESF